MRQEFQVHRLNESGMEKAVELAEIFSRALDQIETILVSSPGRERALVITKLQEASFFAKRALALDPMQVHTVK